jgi:hypothetical protein
MYFSKIPRRAKQKSVCMKYIEISLKIIQPLMEFEKNVPLHGSLLPISKITRLE